MFSTAAFKVYITRRFAIMGFCGYIFMKTEDLKPCSTMYCNKKKGKKEKNY